MRLLFGEHGRLDRALALGSDGRRVILRRFRNWKRDRAAREFVRGLGS